MIGLKPNSPPDYVKKHEDLNYVAKCWLEAANIAEKYGIKKREINIVLD